MYDVAFIVPITRVVKRKVQDRSFGTAEIKKRHNLLVEVVVGLRIEAGNYFQPVKMEQATTASSQRIYTNDNDPLEEIQYSNGLGQVWYPSVR